MEHKVGDIVYFEYYDGSIGNRIIKEIKPKSYLDDNGNTVHYNKYDFGDTFIEDYNCIPEKDPRVQEYIKEEQIKLKQKLNSLYEFIKIELNISKLSDRELNMINAVLKYEENNVISL